MAAVKIQKFLGAAPKISSELLSNGIGQIAYNLQPYSGDLIPYSEPAIIGSVPRLGTIKTLFGMRASVGADIDWLTWLTDVDITTLSASDDAQQRFYYTGDGVPKVTTYALATTGSEPYPLSFYELGLPLPTVVLTSTAVSFSTLTSSFYERDAGNTAIITVGTAHGLRTGNIVTISGFTGDPDPASFNTTNVRITVTSTTKFEYYSSGDAVSSTASTAGAIELSGSTVSRDYTYTWFTPWSEESIGAKPSTTLFIKEGQTIVVTGLPTAAPSGDNFIAGMKLYRTLTSPSGTEFYHLSTLWFPLVASTVLRASNVVTIVISGHHNLIVGDRFKLAKCADATFNITDGIVVAVVNDTTFTYAQTDSDVSVKAETAGTLYHDVAELPANTSRYWGDDSIATSFRERTTNVAKLTTAAAHGLITNQVVTITGMGGSGYNATDVTITVTSSTIFTYANTGSNEGSTADTGGLVTNDSYTDDFDFLNLVDLLLTDNYDAPNEDMIGLTLAQNNMLAGFFDNQLCFAEPDNPHAWPLAYRRTIEQDIVAIEAVGGNLIVLTDTYAYRVSGSDPATLSIARIDTPYPCLSKRSVVNMGFGVMFATYGGMALWSPVLGLALATKDVQDWDTWDNTIDPATIVGHFFNGKYYGSHSTGAFMFERDDKVGGLYVTIGHIFNSAWVDTEDNAFYTSSDNLGNIHQWWGDELWPIRPMEWKSKTIITKDYINIGAARVVADFNITSEDTDAYITYNAGVVTYNTAIWLDSQELGDINGPTDYVDSDGLDVNNFASLNTVVVNGPSTIKDLVRSVRIAPATYTVVFRLWQDKKLVLTKNVTGSEIFRCPTGYKSDTFEVSVAGSARVRAIHLGETPDGLRKA